MLVNGRTQAKSHRLRGGEEVEFDAPERATPELAAEEMDLRIVYEDEHLVVVDKPAGLVVHPGARPCNGNARARTALARHRRRGPDSPGSCIASTATRRA